MMKKLIILFLGLVSWCGLGMGQVSAYDEEVEIEGMAILVGEVVEFYEEDEWGEGDTIVWKFEDSQENGERVRKSFGEAGEHKAIRLVIDKDGETKSKKTINFQVVGSFGWSIYRLWPWMLVVGAVVLVGLVVWYERWGKKKGQKEGEKELKKEVEQDG